MGYTLTSLRAELGEERIQRAIDDQRAWMPRAHADIVALIGHEWQTNPRKAIKHARMLCSFAGFRSYCDTYLLVAFALGKLPFVR